MVSLGALVASYGVILGMIGGSAAISASGQKDARVGRANAIEARVEDFYLRVMPLGASITRGDPPAPGDSEKNGYRKHLRDNLTADGWLVNMVGSVQYGNMDDADNEGWPGYVISQVHDKAKTALPIYKPNLILINAGTNDAQQADKYPLEEAGERMEELIMDCFELSPQTVVVLSTLLPNGNEPANVKEVNRQYADLYEMLRDGGYHIALADMDDGLITIDDIWDNIHPTVEGAKKMASVWRGAIDEVDEAGWLVAPSDDVDFVDGDMPEPAANSGRAVRTSSSDSQRHPSDKPDDASASARHTSQGLAVVGKIAMAWMVAYTLL